MLCSCLVVFDRLIVGMCGYVFGCINGSYEIYVGWGTGFVLFKIVINDLGEEMFNKIFIFVDDIKFLWVTKC